MTLPENVDPQDYDIQLIEGADYLQTFEITDADSGEPLDLTGATFAGTISADYLAASPLLSFTPTSAAPTTGALEVSITAAQIATLNPSYSSSKKSVPIGFYSIYIDSGSNPQRYIEGKITLSRKA